MENEQVREWAEAQKITVSIDLVEAAKTHLNFLAAVEHRNRFLYEEDTLQRSIYRYNAFWLPLLAKHSESPVSEESLVVPLDCELIWHCHRLNPIRYKVDCFKLYGRILTNRKVISSIQATPKSVSATEEVWNKMYPDEPYVLDLLRPISGDVLKNRSENDKFTTYDLFSAVKRQMNFTYQACRPHMLDELFIREALGRYKGYLHIIRTNRKAGLKRFAVPTYDIDLMWHTHQLYPDSYCKDMRALVGFVIQHDDTDSDKSKGSKLDVGYHETAKQWQQMFGSSYWKAGAMSKGKVPSSVSRVPYKSKVERNELNEQGSVIQFPPVDAVEVILEFVDVKNLPLEKKENLLVGFSKNNPVDRVFNTKRWLGISSASEDKLFAAFQCEPTGEFHFELVSYASASDELKPQRQVKKLGSCSLSFGDLVAAKSQLLINKWVSVDLASEVENFEPVLLHVLMSFSPPMPAPQLFQLVHCHTTEHDHILAHVMDYGGQIVFSLLKRNEVKDATKCTSDLLTDVYCITESGEQHALVEFDGNHRSIKGARGSLKLENGSAEDDSLLTLLGYDMMKVFAGRRLEFEPKTPDDKLSETDFKTIVEFSTDYPYGRAVALINSKLGTIKTVDESVILPGAALAFILSDIPKVGEASDFTAAGEDVVENEGAQCQGAKCAGRCVDKPVELLDLFKLVNCPCGPCVGPHEKNEADGAQCIGQCTNCGDTWNEAQCFWKCLPSNVTVGPLNKIRVGGAQCFWKCLPSNVTVGPLNKIRVGGGLCIVRTNYGDAWNAADCACGPCKDNNVTVGPLNKIRVGGAQCIGQCTKCDDAWNAADCACGPCKDN